MLEITPVNALTDNYVWLIHSPLERHRVVIVDPGEVAPVEAALGEHDLSPAAIFVTHHHRDHTGGVAALARLYDLPVFGPALEAEAVVTQPLADGEHAVLPALGLDFEALHIPGHTLGHTAFFGHGAVFSGDTLFSAGCGRLFEGTAAQMSASLQRLAALPDATRVYCGHEYTRANLAFAAAVEPANSAIAEYREIAAARLARGEPTLPSRIDLERAVNPFLRTGEPAVQAAAAEWAGTAMDGEATSVFAALRRWKDNF